MRIRAAAALLSMTLLAPSLWASKEAKKLDKELKKISMTAAVIDGRRVVNRVMAKQLGLSRKQLVEERRQTGFVYGQLFGAHAVARLAGLTFNQVAEQLKQGRSLLEISEQHNLDLKQILSDAKRLNKAIDNELERVAKGEGDEQTVEAADSYDPLDDSLVADTAGFSPAEIRQANDQVHRRGPPFGETGPFGRGHEAGGEGGPPGVSRSGGVAGGVGGGMGGGRGRGPR